MLEPIVRQMILCDDARTRAGTSAKIDIFGYVSTIKAKRLPTNLTFAVFVCLTNGRGAGVCHLVIKHEGSDEEVYTGTEHAFDFGVDPLAIHSFVIRIPCCTFPESGSYLVEFVYNDVVLETCNLRVELVS